PGGAEDRARAGRRRGGARSRPRRNRLMGALKGILRPSLPPGELFGALAEFATPAELYHACEGVRDAGYTRWDAHTPFPIHGLERAMGLKASLLPWVVILMALGGAA